MSIMAQAKGKDTIYLSRNGCAGQPNLVTVPKVATRPMFLQNQKNSLRNTIKREFLAEFNPTQKKKSRHY